MRFRETEPRPTDPDALDVMDDELPVERPRRPWPLIAASLLLVVLVAVLWAKWSDSRTEADQLRAEVKQVYREAETLRTQAAQAEQRLALSDQQMRSLRAERADLLQRLEAAGGEKPPAKAKPVAKPARKRAPRPNAQPVSTAR